MMSRMIFLLAVGLLASSGVLAQTVDAQAVALNANADCGNASLDITLDSSGATTEFGESTLLDGTVTNSFQQSTGIGTFSGTFTGYGIGVNPTQSDGTVIGSYAWIGTDPPDAATTGEFFVLYECSTTGAQNVLTTCVGPFGSCPSTAAEGINSLRPEIAIPTLSIPGLALLVLLLAGLAAWFSLRARAHS